MQRIFFSIVFVAMFISLCAPLQLVFASDLPPNATTVTALPTAGTPSVGISNDEIRKMVIGLNKAKIDSPSILINRAINAMMVFVGSITLALLTWAGALWMTAAGNSEKVDQAKQIFIWTGLGLVAIFSSYILAQFIIKAVSIGNV